MKKFKLLFLCMLTIGIISYQLAIKPINLSSQSEIEDDIPPIVMINDTLYQLYDTNNLSEPKESSAGIINDIVLGQIPNQNEQANFGELGMEYWIIEGSLYIKLNKNILLFKTYNKF